MKRKTIFSILLLVLISFIPIIPWYFLGPAGELEFSYENITHSLGQIAGLVGMTMFAITFVLATRLRIIERFIGGLDQVYLVHSIMGSMSFMILLFHPILLVLKYIPSRVDLAAKYILPFHGLSVDFGIIALVGMIVLLGVTFYVNMKYNYWKMSHKFLGVFFIFAILHIFLVRGTASRDYIFEGYYIYVAIVSAIGITAYLYTLFFKSTGLVIYKIKSIKNKDDTFFDIEMSPIKKPLNYKSGQFAFFRFHNKEVGREFHPFSISSEHDNPNIRIVVKSLGDYTSKLNMLKVGDNVSVEGPYGEFIIRDRSEDMIWISAGIGITPFIGMARDLNNKEGEKKKNGNVTLYYSVKDEKDFIALDELKKIAKDSGSRFKLVPWCSSKDGRMSFKDIKEIDKDMKIYMCGPPAFKESFMKDLLDYGISRENIFDEDFGFR